MTPNLILKAGIEFLRCGSVKFILLFSQRDYCFDFHEWTNLEWAESEMWSPCDGCCITPLMCLFCLNKDNCTDTEWTIALILQGGCSSRCLATSEKSCCGLILGAFVVRMALILQLLACCYLYHLHFLFMSLSYYALSVVCPSLFSENGLKSVLVVPDTCSFLVFNCGGTCGIVLMMDLCLKLLC